MKGRIILQDISTRRYLASDGYWVKDCQQARVFEHTYQALLEGLEHRDKIAQVVWCFQNPGMNMYLAVRPEDNDRLLDCVTCPLADG